MASRIEEQLKTLVDGSGENIEPRTSAEKLLQNVIDGVKEFDPPTSRFEGMVQSFVNGESWDKTAKSRTELIFKAGIDKSDEFPEPRNEYERLLIEWVKKGSHKDYEFEIYDTQFGSGNYIRTNVHPWSQENLNRDWELVYNAVWKAGSSQSYPIGFICNMVDSVSTRPLRITQYYSTGVQVYALNINPQIRGKNYKWDAALGNQDNKDFYLRKIGHTIMFFRENDLLFSYDINISNGTYYPQDEFVIGACFLYNTLAQSKDYVNYCKFKFVDWNPQPALVDKGRIDIDLVGEDIYTGAILGKAVLGQAILGKE